MHAYHIRVTMAGVSWAEVPAAEMSGWTWCHARVELTDAPGAEGGSGTDTVVGRVAALLSSRSSVSRHQSVNYLRRWPPNGPADPGIPSAQLWLIFIGHKEKEGIFLAVLLGRLDRFLVSHSNTLFYLNLIEPFPIAERCFFCVMFNFKDSSP